MKNPLPPNIPRGLPSSRWMLDNSSPTHTTRPHQKPQLIPLSNLAASSEETVADIAEGPHRTRYMKLGFVPGAHVVIIRAGDPALVSLNGNKLALSQRCLENILVAHVENR